MNYVLTVNGVEYPVSADASRSLLSVIRSEIGLTGTKEGCSNGNCGSCTVLLDGAPVNACLVLAQEAPGHDITTIEGFVEAGKLTALQENLSKMGGTQCGFCTPGIAVSAAALLAENPTPSEQEIRHAIAGNLCRCTGYDKIIRAIARTAEQQT